MISSKNNNSNLVAGLSWSFLERFGSQFISLVISIILARILLPSDYGPISAISIFTVIATTFVSGGFSSAIIQKKTIDQIELSSMFFFNVLFSLVLYTIIFITAPFLVKIFNNSYNHNLLSLYLRVSGIGIFFASINSFFRSFLSKKLEFKKIFYITIIGTVFSGLVGIIMALSNFGVWALIFQTLSSYLINFILFFFFSKWKPSLKFSLNKIKPLILFGGKLMLSSLITTLYLETYSIIIGNKYEPEQLAYYNKGVQFPKLFVSAIVGAINSVLFPIMSKMTTKEEYKQCVKKMNMMSCYFIFPFVFGLAAVANNFVSVILTDKWLPCVVFLQIACFDYALQPIGLANLQCWKADGRGTLYLVSDIIKKLIGFALIFLAVQLKLGIYGIAASAFFATFFSFFINLIPGKRVLNYSIFEQIYDILPNILIALGMFAFVFGLDAFLDAPSYICLIIEIIFGAFSYFLLCHIFNLSQQSLIFSFLKKTKNKH